MRHSLLAAVAACLVVSAGCGRSPEQATGPSNQAPANANAASKDAPVQTVTRFLDALRRGGGEQTVASLLTEAARKECQRTGLVIEPPGSPEAKFEVTRGEMIPGRQDAALVHSVWTEPAGGEGPAKYEVVWAVKQETPGQWRICGMIAQLPGQQPVAIDFENGDEILAHLNGNAPGAAPAAQSPSAQTAAAPQTEAKK